MTKKTEQDNQLELVYGLHPIRELLRAKRRHIRSLHVLKGESRAFAQIQAMIPARVPVHQRTREELTRLAGTADHQGIVAWATPFEVRKKPFDPAVHKVLVLLDGIQDTRNLGAILRSAYCTGVHGVIITKKSSAPINATALKASAGLAEHMQIAVAPSAKHALVWLKAAGYHVYIAALSPSGKNAATVAYQEPLCIVIGSEGFGVSSDILSMGTVVMLPQKTADISYNASVAAGILLFVIAQQQNLFSSAAKTV